MMMMVYSPRVLLLLVSRIVMAVVVCRQCQGFDTMEFRTEPMCLLSERISRECSREVSDIRSLAECASVCGQLDESSCVGASWSDQGKSCFLHGECPGMAEEGGSSSSSSCGGGGMVEEDTDHRYVARPCVHGTWDDVTQACQCASGAHGPQCKHYPSTCMELVSHGVAMDVHKTTIVSPRNDGGGGGGPDLLQVLCDLSREPVMERIIVMRNQGWADFNRTWNEYATGFYIDDKNMWLGLEPLHQLTTAGYKRMNIYIRFKEPYEENFVAINHSPFVVLDKSAGYKMNFTSHSVRAVGDLLDKGTSVKSCLPAQRVVEFSTWDMDRDREGTANCAARAGSGWWYSGCYTPCNLLGFGVDHWARTTRMQRMSFGGIDMTAIGHEIEELVMELLHV